MCRLYNKIELLAATIVVAASVVVVASERLGRIFHFAEDFFGYCTVRSRAQSGVESCTVLPYILMYRYLEMAESPFMMQVHGSLAGGVSYIIMTMGLGQDQQVAVSRSFLIANLTAAYMIVFGHALPSF